MSPAAVDQQPASQDYIDQLVGRVNRHLEDGKTLPEDLLQRFPALSEPHPKKILKATDVHDPELQQALSYLMQYTPSVWLLEQEKAAIIARRKLHGIPVEETPEPNIHCWARDNQLTGLCFSGGGIRSATFNLGVLQALAMQDRLKDFDYLSSVSGGGYIHGWLAAWLLRKTREDKNPKTAWDNVMKRLHPLSTGDAGSNQFVWPRQIQWLRRYSNYLTPRKGLMSGDTWAASAVWLRNVLLNQALLLTIFLFVLCVPHTLTPASRLVHAVSGGEVKTSTISTVAIDRVEAKLTLQVSNPPDKKDDDSDYGDRFKEYFKPPGALLHWRPWWAAWPGPGPWTWTAAIFYLVGSYFIGHLLWLEYRGARPGSGENALPSRRGEGRVAWVRRHEFGVVCWFVVLPLFLFGLSLTFIVRSHVPCPFWTVKVFGLLLMLVWIETFCGGAISNSVAQEQDMRKASNPRVKPTRKNQPGLGYAIWSGAKLMLLGIPAAATGAVLAVAIAALVRCAWMWHVSQWLLLSDPRPLQLTVGTLLFFWIAPLTMVVASGMIGKRFPGWMGEWLARIRGYTLITGMGWVGLCGGALLLPGMVVRLAGYHWIGWTSVSAWLGTTALGVLSGKSGKTSGDQNSGSGVLDRIAMIAPYVYILGLLVLLSWLMDVAQDLHWVNGTFGWLWAMLVLGLLAGLLAWRLDINQFSMHTFYRNRLTRCYLGASNPLRNPSPITGFDEHDSSDLCIHDFTPDRYPGPIPIFSCAMNITTGEDLAWQERKAASFAFTPYYSGYTVGWTGMGDKVKFNGFVPTRMLYPGGPTVATAMAASGAAISPNWGYHTNPATAFLLTMFDARLGLWVPNPRRSDVAGRQPTKAAVPPASPWFSLIPLMGELSGSVNDTSEYVYVTDGGHFDNSGLYELVRRRCYRIVICDAEEDGAYEFEGIGAAIRKCRIDFGAEIELDLSGLVPNSKTLLSPGHVAHGFIRYPETQGCVNRGTVTYIKSSLMGEASPAAEVEGAVALPNVPGDVQAYKRQNKDFPHDSTAEQWFTESQFESYRRLGQAIVEGLS